MVIRSQVSTDKVEGYEGLQLKKAFFNVRIPHYECIVVCIS